SSCDSSSIEKERLKRAGDAYVLNYPNPFHTTTTIKYESDGSHVVVQVFNGQGQIIQTLVNEFVPEGVHEVQFNGTGMAAGTYYYRYQRGGLQQTKAMLKI
ncbi:MAG: hypothetical protein ACI8ZN_002356, partial [Bacteroidia bacterium]